MTTWNLSETKHHVLICNGSSCMRKGGEEATQAFRDEITKLDLDSTIHTTRTRCNGRCKDACVAIVYPEGTWYKGLTPELSREIVQQHLVKGEIVEEAVIYQYENNSFTPPVNSKSIKGIEKPVKENV
ncbi:(2Fe-2S) ferredoxin domain-containing protein [Bacillus weihaiensis]|uniref:Cobalamin biosynthesis protein n=1 Tax=Bacillus weihaiensis TaxID=1547283 RepID=A0A1L3MRV6_9BACI|nr:(2Fe-2S) ferredoxin domain-containing protein [Bacillus weihaiensis]APH05063.1 hypothetical protein A9C19_10055 [Bacillus weihaiensis]